MFGFLALGFFSAMALKNNQNGGSGGGLLAGIVAALASIKMIKQYLKDLGWAKDKDKDKEKEDEKSDYNDIDGGDYEKDFGITGLDAGKDEEIDSVTLNKNRSLAMMQRAVENATEEEKEKTQKAYDSYLKCMYNDDGTEKTEEEMNAALQDLKTNNKDLYDSITDSVKTLSEDPKAMDEYTKEVKNINPNQAAAAAEQAQADRIRIRMKEQTEEVDKDIEQLETNTSEEDKEKDEYKDKLKDLQERKKAIETQGKSEIKEHEDKAKSLKNKPYEGVQSARENEEISQGLNELKENRELRKELGGKDGVSTMTAEYKKYSNGIEGFTISQITGEELSEDEERQINDFCKENNIDRGALEAYYDYQQCDPKDKDKKKKAFEDKVKKQISKQCDTLDKEYEQKRKSLQEKVNKHNETINKNKTQQDTAEKTAQQDTTGETGFTQKKEDNKTDDKDIENKQKDLDAKKKEYEAAKKAYNERTKAIDELDEKLIKQGADKKKIKAEIEKLEKGGDGEPSWDELHKKMSDAEHEMNKAEKNLEDAKAGKKIEHGGQEENSQQGETDPKVEPDPKEETGTQEEKTTKTNSKNDINKKFELTNKEGKKLEVRKEKQKDGSVKYFTKDGDKEKEINEETFKKAQEKFKKNTEKQVEKLQKELKGLDEENDKDRIKEIQDELKSNAKSIGKKDSTFLPKEETHGDKKYKTMVGPRKGKYYKVNSGSGWGPWNNYTGKHPWESLISDYLKDRLIVEHFNPKNDISEYLKSYF